jgi:ATP-dependent DNA ligase
VSPLILKRRAAAFDNPDYLYELKYDGFRALLEVDGGEARLVSRNRNRFRHLDRLAAALVKRLRVTNAVLDGEACCIDETGRPVFIDLLAAVEERDLEGIVAKKKADPYRRGVSWWKIKNPAYSQAEGRHEAAEPD